MEGLEVVEEADLELFEELQCCNLCEWECDVNRLKGERGVCGLTIPLVAHSTLHPAPPASFDAFMAGCNLHCIFCQNWSIACYPFNHLSEVEGYYSPKDWARLGVSELQTTRAKMMGADRLFFTGGEPTPSLTWIEHVVEEARKIDPGIKVNYDTNGFLTTESLKRVLKFTTSITYDIKAVREKTFTALTGAFVEPVLRNAEYIANHAKDKLWEFRVMVIEGVHDDEVKEIAAFVADLDPSLPVNFLAFRPNFAMSTYHGPTWKYMEKCVYIAKEAGLENVSWSGLPTIKGEQTDLDGTELVLKYARIGG